MRAGVQTIFIIILAFVLAIGWTGSADAELREFYQGHFNDPAERGHGWGLSMDLLEGYPVMAYYAKLSDATAIHFARWNFHSGQWDIEEVDTYNSGASYIPREYETSLVVRDGKPHIFYSAHSNELRHAFRVDGSWSVESITPHSGNSGGLFPSAVSLADGFAVCYQDASSRSLWVAEGDSGSWQLTQLSATDSASGTYCHIARKIDGEPAIASSNGASFVPEFVERVSGEWQPLLSLAESNASLKLLTPHILVRANGDLRVYYHALHENSAGDGSVHFAERPAHSDAWTTQGVSISSYTGGHPVFLERSDGRLFGAIRRRMASAIFGRSSSLVRYEEVEGGNTIKGYTIAGRCSGETGDLSLTSIRENLNGSLFVAFFDPTCSYNNVARIILASDTMGSDLPPGVGPNVIQLTVKDENDKPLIGATVELDLSGQKFTSYSDAAGVARVEFQGKGTFTLKTSMKGFTFEDIEGEATPKYQSYSYISRGYGKTGAVECSFDTSACSPASPARLQGILAEEYPYSVDCCYFPDGEQLCCS